MSEHASVREWPGGPREAAPDALADGFRGTDVGNADRLVAAAGGRIRYVHAWGRWIVYREGRWIVDNGDTLITEAAKQVARRMFTFAARLSPDARDDLWKWARRSETATAINAMVRLARGIDGVLVDHGDLDADPWLLDVNNGTVDLRTGKLLAHNPEHLLTMRAPVMFDPDADAPLWRRCVERWQPDPELRGYLQRVAGSAITGRPVEHFFVNLGEGANGKGKFFGAINRVLGDYYVVPHKSLLVVQRYEQHDTVRAKLFRARMVVGAETEQGDRLDESKIKDLTGGDPLEARRMREDPWAFLPTWTMFLHTNHRPRVRGTDEGIWRRVRLIPWTVTIPEAERDDHLADKLAAEGPGVLNWLIAGCLEWQERSLDDPETVKTATRSWRGDEDLVTRWLDDCTVQGGEKSAAAAALRQSHERWCAQNGEPPCPPRRSDPSWIAAATTATASARTGPGRGSGSGCSPRSRRDLAERFPQNCRSAAWRTHRDASSGYPLRRARVRFNWHTRSMRPPPDLQPPLTDTLGKPLCCPPSKDSPR